MEPDRTLDRRQFFATAMSGLTRKAGREIAGGFAEDGHTAGHALRDHTMGATPRESVRVPVVVVGGGVAGLSAAWRFAKRGFRDFVVLELNAQAGGNARWGENEVTAFPWAAHYVPIPNRETTLVRELMSDLGVLKDGRWDERALCYSPQERLFLHGRWQEGIEPELAATARDREQFRRFHDLMHAQRATGQFTIPLEVGARESPLDAITMTEWMRRNGFDSPYLNWYVDYACRDDYGGHAREVSAWAGVHYFASREHDEKGPLTWPEGNGWIVRRLLERLGPHVRTNAPVARIERAGRRLRVLTPATEYTAEHVVFAAPTFLARYLVEGAPAAPIVYSPWVTANLVLDRLPPEEGFPLAWDNVTYNSPTLGYVVANHQSLASRMDRSVWTWYHALASGTPAENRRMLLEKPWTYWRDFILRDLARAHPDIGECVARIDVLRIGHAMARPVPGAVARLTRGGAGRPLGNIHFAHSDLSGLSIFEEAQYHGVRAADEILRRI